MISKERFLIYCDISTSRPIISRAFKIALVVGSILNLINQGHAIIHLHLQDIHIFKLLLTYLVPYGVTTYTATALKLEFQIGTKSLIDADLKCKVCKAELQVHKDALIKECQKCGINTKWRLK